MIGVADRGPGIEDHERARTSRSSIARRHRFATKGTGMGLAIAKGIVEAHGEKIWVESEPGQGAVFYFSLAASGEAAKVERRKNPGGGRRSADSPGHEGHAGGPNYEVIEARTGEEALEIIPQEQPNLILLDMNMPGMGGLETCRAIRAGSDTPVIILSVRNTEKDKVAALDAGADDYVTKPFGIEELLARIRAALRRSSPEGGPRAFQSEGLEIDFDTRRVHARGADVRLTPKEFELLRYLVAHAGKPVTHRELLQAVWGPDYGDEPEYLRVFINQVRKKIEPNPAKPKYIVTVPWVGYQFAGAA